ncbi:MAG: right-handed parallel beta-helix repeat-containing protein [Planctomycetota bacterium]
MAPHGQDGAGNGSETRPFQSVDQGLAAARPGDRVVLRAGEYRLAETLRFPRAGERGRPITLAAHQGEYVALLGSVRLTGWRRHQGDVWKVKAPPRQVKGLFEDGERLVHPRERGKREDPPVEALRAPGRWTQRDGWVYLWTRQGDPPERHRIEASQRGIVNLNRPWLRIEGLHLFYGQPTGLVISADHCVAARCEVAGVSNSVDNAYGAYLSRCSNSAFRECVVRDSFYWGDHGSNSHVVSCIDCGDRGPNVVDRCEIFNGGLGVGTKGAAREMVVRDCRIYDVLNGVVPSGQRSSGPGAGKTDRGHYLIWRNHIHDCRRGVYFSAGDTRDNRVINNVFERCDAGVYMRKVQGLAQDTVITNNVFATCDAGLFLLAEREGIESLAQFAAAGLRSDHNLFWRNEADWRHPLTWGRSIELSRQQVARRGEADWEQHSISADPLLDGSARAREGSPTLGRGVAVPLPASVGAPSAWHIGLGPRREAGASGGPALRLSIAGSQTSVGPGDTLTLQAVLRNQSREHGVALDGDAVVTFHFRYANAWYFDRQEIWRVRVRLPGDVLAPGGAVDLTKLPGWQSPTNRQFGDPFHLRADDRYWRTGWRLRATLRRVSPDMPTHAALQRLEPLIRSEEVLRGRLK